MSVNSHLVALASDLVRSEDETAKIATSIQALAAKAKSYFGREITAQLKFGSITRGTILPRKADEDSDVDYMMVFDASQGKLKPQSYLSKIKRFVENSYASSEIHQSSPTIVLELTHIKFDLVPALHVYGNSYEIPSPDASYQEWLTTNPNEFNDRLSNVNMNNRNQIKPLVRLIKYWNALNYRHFQSFDLENYVCGLTYYGCSSLSDFFYNLWAHFTCRSGSQTVLDKVDRAKQRVAKIQNLERQGFISQAENEISNMLPRV